MIVYILAVLIFADCTSGARVVNLNERTISLFSRDLRFYHPRNLVGRKRVGRDLKLTDDEGLRLTQTIQIDDRKSKLKFKEYYKDIPVFGSNLVVETLEGQMTGKLSGHIVEGISDDLRDVEAQVTRTKALLIAIEVNRDNPYHVEFDPNRDIALEVYLAETGSGVQVTALLVYRVSYLILEPNRQSRPFTIIDAITGDVIRVWDGLASLKEVTNDGEYFMRFKRDTDTIYQEEDLKHLIDEIEVQHSPKPKFLKKRNAEEIETYEYVGYGGNKKIGKYEYGYDLPPLEIVKVASICYLENWNVRVIDDNYEMNGDETFSFLCENGTSDSINGAYSPAADAFYFNNVVHKLYVDWLGEPPLGLDTKLNAHVHYAREIENAFWTGSGVKYGDGNKLFYPFTVLDIVAHEISHGFTEKRSGLIYTGESGSVNEAFSDIVGAAAEEYLRETDWYQGKGNVKSDEAHLSRYLIDPPLDGLSVDMFDDYCPGMDVHLACGIINKAFYKLTQMEGWSVKKGFEVYSLANMLYWLPHSTMAHAACGVLQAAEDLEYSTDDVIASFNQVGLEPCVDNDHGLHLSSNLNFVQNTSVTLKYELDYRTNFVRFEILQGWFNRTDLVMSLINPDGSTVVTAANTSQLVIDVENPQQGDYQLDVTANGATSAVDIFAISSVRVLVNNIHLDAFGRASGNFTLPLMVWALGRPVILRMRNPDNVAPMMYINFDTPVDLPTGNFHMKSHFQKDNTDNIFTEMFLCKPKNVRYFYHLRGMMDSSNLQLTLVTPLLPRKISD